MHRIASSSIFKWPWETCGHTHSRWTKTELLLRNMYRENSHRFSNEFQTSVKPAAFYCY